MANHFGDFIRNLRLQFGLTLRDFCQKNNLDPGNVSRLERGMMPAPQSQKKLIQYARSLGIRRGTQQWTTFMDMAAASSGKIPSDLMSNERVISRLPAFFRTLRSKKLSDKDIEDLIDRLRGT